MMECPSGWCRRAFCRTRTRTTAAYYPFDDQRRRRSRRTALAELAVLGGVRDTVDQTLVVESRQVDAVLETVWRR